MEKLKLFSNLWLRASFFSLIVIFALAPLPAAAVGVAEISFSYSRQSGPGSNQFAVWVEDRGGDTLRRYMPRISLSKGVRGRATIGVMSEPPKNYKFCSLHKECGNIFVAPL
jgi:hypothetical protein